MNCCFCHTPITSLDPSEKKMAQLSREVGIQLGGRICCKCLQRLRPSSMIRGKDRRPAASLGLGALEALRREDYPTFVRFSEELRDSFNDADHRVEKAMKEVQRLIALRNYIFDFKNKVEHAMHNSPAGKYLSRRIEANAAISDTALRFRIFSRDGFKCMKCARPDNLSIDHIKSVLEGGSDEDQNLQTLCRSCNSSKGSCSS